MHSPQFFPENSSGQRKCAEEAIHCVNKLLLILIVMYFRMSYHYKDGNIRNQIVA